MTTEQFNQLLCICKLDGLCESLIHTMYEKEDNIPEEIDYEAGLLRMAASSFRDAIWKYKNRNMDTYIDKEESNNENHV